MEEQLVRLLAETQSSQEGLRKHAELQLKDLHTNAAFPQALVSVAAHDSVSLAVRQSALLYLKTFVLAAWSPQFDEFESQVLVSDDSKQQLRRSVLEIATGSQGERKLKSAASLVVSKIASSDFPDEWPDLLPTLLAVISNGTDLQLHGALKVLGDLVEDGFNEEQFFKVARDLVRTVFDVAVNDTRKPTLRALAISVFRACFDTLEMVMEDHKAAVKGFAQETIGGWVPLFITTLKTKLPPTPSEDDEGVEAGVPEYYRGMVALKLQVVKLLVRIRSLFPSTLASQMPALFAATWEELSSLQEPYHQLYINDDRQGRLEDADGLPYTLDFLVLEELDFMQACLRLPLVRQQLQQQLQAANGVTSNTWITEVMKLAVAYAQITTEEEGLWDIDVNVFLSEEVQVTSNYTPRTACGDLLIKLGEWLNTTIVETLLAYTRTLYSEDTSWKAKEAALYLLNQLLSDFQDVERSIGPDSAQGYVEFIQYAVSQKDIFLRARGFLVAGSLTRTSGDTLLPIATSFMENTLNALSNDESEVVKVSCIRALQYYLAAMPKTTTLPMQPSIISALANFLSTLDVSDITDSDDLMIAIVETLRDALLLDPRICLTGGGLNLLFTIASHGSNNFQLVMLITETFEEIASTLSASGPESYEQLCANVLPSLTGAFDIGTLTEENALTNLAAELLSVLASNGSTPLPPSFIPTTMPKLQRLLLGSQDEELLRAATSAVQQMLRHDPAKMFAWQDPAGKGGLEVILIIIDRLLSPNVDDNAAAEVGGLAAELVEKAGSEQLGPYLMQLLQAVAARLATATKAPFIQSLILVFARLSLVSPSDVVDFLAQVQLGNESGLQVVMSKWLENSATFAGYEEIRQNVSALANIYNLNHPHLAQLFIKGDLIVPASHRIMTRSRARQNPDQYTIVPAPLKIIKVLIEELLTASGGQALDAAAAAAELENNGSDEEGGWEDEPGGWLDLGTGKTKEGRHLCPQESRRRNLHPQSLIPGALSLTTLQELMAWAEDEGEGDAPRGRDDATQEFLLQFFRDAAAKAEFAEVFNVLTLEEQEKLRRMS
ncbi:hypothetical protein LTR66_001213 [Elasticomyces elasticus]|nr:hypothetical protein LTR66_001213 [Elasticomyces elasticus]